MISTSSTRAIPFPSSWLALCALLLCVAFPAHADERVESARGFMSKTVSDVLAILDDKQLAPDVRLQRLESIALERFDFPRMALLVLGMGIYPFPFTDVMHASVDHLLKHVAITKL